MVFQQAMSPTVVSVTESAITDDTLGGVVALLEIT